MGCSVSTDPKTSGAVNALFDAKGEKDIGNGRKMVRVDEFTNASRIGQVHALLSRAFCGTDTAAPDPVISWVYDPTDTSGTAGKPLSEAPSQERVKWFDYFWQLNANSCMPYGGVYALVDTATDKVIGAACTNPPSETGIHVMGMCPYMGLMKNLGSCPKPGMDRISPLVAVMEKMHKKHTSGRHLYIMAFATDPSVQGTGVGTALLQFLMTVADADFVDAYLETAGERNMGFYAKKGGFQDKEAMPVEHKGQRFELSGGLHCMVRPAGSAAGKTPVQPTS